MLSGTSRQVRQCSPSAAGAATLTCMTARRGASHTACLCCCCCSAGCCCAASILTQLSPSSPRHCSAACKQTVQGKRLQQGLRAGRRTCPHPQQLTGMAVLLQLEQQPPACTAKQPCKTARTCICVYSCCNLVVLCIVSLRPPPTSWLKCCCCTVTSAPPRQQQVSLGRLPVGPQVGTAAQTQPGQTPVPWFPGSGQHWSPACWPAAGP